MKKLLVYSLLAVLSGYLVFLASCGSDNEFETENTFNLDTLFVQPSQNITDNFEVYWGVTTQGFPQFLIQIYLSDDEVLDAGDFLIAETADTDTSTDPDQQHVNRLYFRLLDETGGAGTGFEFSYDQENWLGEAVTQEDLSGKTKYIIGRFYHTPGLQIQVFRTRMAVEVSFQ